MARIWLVWSLSDLLKKMLIAVFGIFYFVLATQVNRSKFEEGRRVKARQNVTTPTCCSAFLTDCSTSGHHKFMYFK